MIQVRRNTFETNSSSMHNLVLFNNAHEQSPSHHAYIDRGQEYDTVCFYDIDYSREPLEILNNWVDKLGYLIAAWWTLYYPCRKRMLNALNEISAILHKHVPGLQVIELGHAQFIWRYDTTAEQWFEEPSDDESYWIDWIGVDHQSMNVLAPEIAAGRLDPEEFLFSPEWCVIIDGDEYHAFDHLLEGGIIDATKIVTRWNCYYDSRSPDTKFHGDDK